MSDARPATVCRGLRLAPGTPCAHPQRPDDTVLPPSATAGPTSLDAVELPASLMTQDYLKAVYNALEWAPGGATTGDLAARMGVGAPTVSENVTRLAAAGLLHHRPYGPITLTAAGHRIALAMVRRHRLVETYLSVALGYGWHEVHEDAEVLEHAVSERLLTRMDEVLGHPGRDPHGDPIPHADGSMVIPPAHRLDDVEPGTPCRIVRISDAESQLLSEVAAHGLELDTEITAGVLDLTPAAVAAIWVVAARGSVSERTGAASRPG